MAQQEFKDKKQDYFLKKKDYFWLTVHFGLPSIKCTWKISLLKALQ